MWHPAIVTLASSLLVSACSTGQHGSSLPTTPSSPTTQPSSTTTLPPPTTQPSNCATAQLSVATGMRSGAAGTIGLVIIFTNTSTATCTFFGFPGVAGLDAVGNQVAQASRVASPGLPPRLLLTPGATASAMVLASDVPEGTAETCSTYTALLVTPPNAYQSVRVDASMPACGGLRVGPVYSGTTGQPTT